MKRKGVPGRMGELPTRIAVIGAGLMGHGIAQAFAQKDYPNWSAIFLSDSSLRRLNR